MKNFNLISLVGILAGILSAIFLLPQLIKMITERKYESVSPWMLLILLIGLTLWISYGILKNDIPIIATNSFSLLINIVMVFMRLNYRKGQK